MAYFDNAATTYPKPESVYSFMDTFYRMNGGNAGRGQHAMAQTAGALIAETRVLLQGILHCPAKQVVFEPTATIALNIIIQGIIKLGVRNVYISPFEHNAVTRTLHHFESEGAIKVHQLVVTQDFRYDLEKIRYQFERINPDFVIVSHASNAIGLVAPVEDIFSLAKKFGAYTLVDMAQTAGLVDLNVGLNTIDFAVFAGHKTLYGPTGISGFVMEPTIKLPSVIFGGTGYESANQDMPESLPEKYEVGTMNIAGIAGLNASLKWICDTSIESLITAEKKKRSHLLRIINNYDFLHVVGNSHDSQYVGIVSCIMDGISSDSAARIFEQQDISVRTGLHCAPLAHKFLGTYPTGTIRFSVSYFTTEEDFQKLQDALDYIEDNL